MSFSAEQVHHENLIIEADPGGSDEIYYVLKAPRAISVVGAYAVVEQTQNAGTATKFQIEDWGTAGTAVEGTIAAFLGGTTSGSELTARTPAAFTIVAAQNNLDEGDWIVVRTHEDGSSGWISSDRYQIVVQYTLGLGA